MEFLKDFSIEWERKRKTVFQRFQETFLTQSREISFYLREIKEEREEKMKIFTLDEIGVIAKEECISFRSFIFNFENSVEEKEFERMQDFLEHSNRIEKLAFIRDANYRYVVAPGYDEVILELLIELLRKMDLYDEANRMIARI
ncbi:hypothetical protein [Niallia sp. 01092]|uniref:hypothetical protein n=1 Tax=unclassified Niallia TaxID=2837522 RepID=UPI003FD4B269